MTQKNPSRSGVGRVSGRLTAFLGTSVSLRTTANILRHQVWLRPLIGGVVLALIGAWVSHSVETAMRDHRADELRTTRDADVAAVREWIRGQEENVRIFADDDRLVAPIKELLTLSSEDAPARRLVDSKAQEQLRKRVMTRIQSLGYIGFLVVSSSATVLASNLDEAVGKRFPTYEAISRKAMAGQATVTKPFRSVFLLPDTKGELHPSMPTMIAAAAVRDDQGKPIAVLCLRLRPEQFTDILQVARAGKSGETYAFDKNGTFLSQSRFDEELKQIGMLVDKADTSSILTLEARDPEVDLTKGARAALRRPDQPLTRAAADATAGNTGEDVDGYRNYRGVPVVGAWAWLPENDFGVTTEIAVSEAFAPLYVLRRALWLMLGLLALSAVAIYAFMWYAGQQQRKLQEAVLHAKKLGQYTLQDKLGAGGMGTVYRAQHALLRRPTAVKLLEVDKMSEAAVARFEREVQLTGSLTHPNTVAIFDYGRTPEGIFYYVMEYLDGMNLDDLVRRFGPVPEARVVYILKQICGALGEAHAAGLVHRDVKPANVFLTCRGGMYDFVKVLDFGLVKDLDGASGGNITSANAVTGTPLYLSPEGVRHPEQVDARSDVYAIGAVAYFLLTSTPVFNGESVMEICMKHVQTTPDTPSSRLGRPISHDLEALVLRCLAKAQDDRPSDASAVLTALESCAVEGKWTAHDARLWWQHHARELAAGDPAPTLEVPSDPMKSTGGETVAYGASGAE